MSVRKLETGTPTLGRENPTAPGWAHGSAPRDNWAPGLRAQRGVGRLRPDPGGRGVGAAALPAFRALASLALPSPCFRD